MKKIALSALLLASTLPACGKKAEPVAAADAAPLAKPEPTPPPAADAAPAPAADAAPAPAADAAPAPAPDVAPAPADADAPAADAGAPAADAGAAPAAIPAQSGYWAPLFEKGKVSTWDVTELVTHSEMPEDGKGEPKVTNKNLAGKMTCTVKDVQALPPKDVDGKQVALFSSTIECEGYAFDHGVQEGPMGTWVTDGVTLWKRLGDTDEVRMLAEPKAETTKSEELEVIWTAGEAEGTWCWKMNLLMGDGGVLEACYDKAKGPTKYFGHGGSAATDSKVTVTLAP